MTTKMTNTNINKLYAQQLNINTFLENTNTPNLFNSTGNLSTNSIDTHDIYTINNLYNNHHNEEENSNINQIMKTDNMQNDTMQNINTTKKNYNNKKFNIIKYLGEGIQGSLYLANDNKKNNYICKKIVLKDYPKNNDQYNQLNFELNILKYLSSNKVTRQHINPCLEHKIIDKYVFTIFPIFNGYSLKHLTKYLKNLNNKKSYYTIIFHLIKVILHGLAKIHQFNVSHQNINDNSILVSTYTNHNEIKVKFTDFGLGCGQNDLFSKIKSCSANNFAPVKITDDIIDKLSESEYLSISQKYDLLCLGIIFIKLLLLFEDINLDINLNKGYNTNVKNYIDEIIKGKYLSKLEDFRNKKSLKDNDGSSLSNIFKSIDVDYDTKLNILEYLKIFSDYIFCKTKDRQTCQSVLDKIIIYEKYKNEVF